MTPTEHAQLLRELADSVYTGYTMKDSRLRKKARAAAEETEGRRKPTNDDLIQLAIDTRLYRFQATAGDPVQYEMTEQQIHAFARAVLARFGGGEAQ